MDWKKFVFNCSKQPVSNSPSKTTNFQSIRKLAVLLCGNKKMAESEPNEDIVVKSLLVYDF